MYIKVKLTPNAKKEALVKKGDTFLVSVKEPAKQNLANKRLCQLVASDMGVSSGAVKIVSGHTGRTKILSMPD